MMKHCHRNVQYYTERKNKMLNENIYQENGYADRDDYLNCLSEDYGVSIEDVYSLAEMLGEHEDFDGLVSVLEDAECLL